MSVTKVLVIAALALAAYGLYWFGTSLTNCEVVEGKTRGDCPGAKK